MRYQSHLKLCVLFKLMFISLILQSPVLAQTYSYTQYGVKEGLAGATIYSMIEDRDGFMWFGTETGLSRFDGTHFYNFTTGNGLPDNEILKIFQDSKGRIWLLPFKNSICYYFNGKIYNQVNDSLLSKINIKSRVLNIIEDHNGTIWLSELNALHQIHTAETRTINELDAVRISGSLMLGKGEKDTIWISIRDKSLENVYSFANNRMAKYCTVTSKISQNEYHFSGKLRFWRLPEPNNYYAISPNSNIGRRITLDAYKYKTISVIDEETICFNTTEGSIEYDFKRGAFQETFLPGKPVSNTLVDAEGSLWFATLGHGVYRLNSRNVKNLTFSNDEGELVGCQSMSMSANTILVGTADGHLIELNRNNLSIQKRTPPLKSVNSYTIYYTAPAKNGIILFTGNGIFRYPYKNNEETWIDCFTKSVFKYNGDIFIATANSVLRFNPSKFAIVDTPWKERATCVYVTNDSIYVGTLAGLFLIPPSGKVNFLGDSIPVFKRRISAIQKDRAGHLWISTYDEGVVRYANGKLLDHITTKRGMPSNICRNLFIDTDGIVWVGTSNGVALINSENVLQKIKNLSISDGLASNIINNILVDDDAAYIATPAGVSWIDKNRLDQKSSCRLYLLEVTVGKNSVPVSSQYTLKREKRNVELKFVGISYRSIGEITYRYRIKEFDSEWRKTNSTNLELVSLPYGKHTLEIVATNKFGVESRPLTLSFLLPMPFWKSAGFYALLGLVITSLVFIIYKARVKTIRKEEAQKTALHKKLAQMELKALRAQMNPHFTFNVLNSIQYYINYNDIHSAQKYIARFAKLIRMILDTSRKLFISLSEELRMLELYLELEQMRLENGFNYTIEMEEGIDVEKIQIPGMLIQPYIENSIKHGFKDIEIKARLKIQFQKKGNHIICKIIDNGKGRQYTRKPATDYPEHASTGTLLIAERIDALRSHFNYDIDTRTEDIIDDNGKVAGTVVTLFLPTEILVL